MDKLYYKDQYLKVGDFTGCHCCRFDRVYTINYIILITSNGDTGLPVHATNPDTLF